MSRKNRKCFGVKKQTNTHNFFTDSVQNKIAVETAIFSGKTTGKNLATIKNCKINSIELCAVRHRFDYYDKPYSSEIINFIKQENMNVPSMHLPFGETLDISNPNVDIRRAGIQDIARCVDIGTQLGTEVLVLHPGYHLSAKSNREEHVKYAVESIFEILGKTPVNMKIAVENLLPEYLACTVKELVDIVKEVNNERVGYCIDLGHAHISNSLAELMSECGARTFNLHLHDNSGDKDAHLMPSAGNIAWQDIFHRLKQSGFKGLITYEMVNVENPEKNLREIPSNFNWLNNLKA